MIQHHVAFAVRKSFQFPQQQPIVLFGVGRLALKLRCERLDRTCNRDAPVKDGGGRGHGFIDLSQAFPRLGRLPYGNHCFGFVPVGFPGLLPAELAAKCPRDVNEAGALFPAASPLFKLARAGVFSVATFTCSAVPAIQGECHFFPPSLYTIARYCTLEWGSACKVLILLWRREWDSNPR